MNAYLGIKYHADTRNRPLIEALARALETAGCTTACVARDVERWGAVVLDADALMRETVRIFECCDLAVIDLTEKGVGIEAGYAHARGIPVVTVARRGSDISQTLRGISRMVCEYDDPGQLIACFEAMK